MSAEKRKRLAEKGRRTCPVAFYCTIPVKEDSEAVAAALGMSHSRLWTAIAERLSATGFSIAGFTKVGMQLHRRMDEKRGILQQLTLPLTNPFVKLPPLPFAEEEEGPLSKEEGEGMIRELQSVIEEIRQRMEEGSAHG